MPHVVKLSYIDARWRRDAVKLKPLTASLFSLLQSVNEYDKRVFPTSIRTFNFKTLRILTGQN